ncbi:MAG: hypothetical protein CML67_10435 [Rhodobacteraceae bacterium]|uniref:YkvA family protein n=1 Tax=Stappia sp. TaxID=1870903 RepID=UPI000C3B68C1|nr:hypothetical protein [Paracoccaceae bacterium]MBL6431777.1 DUF1232 domain-containing protein [Alphaproteobacteria bacterium]
MAASYDNLGIDPEYLGPEEERERKVRARIFDVARKAAGQIPFMEDVIAAYYCALDPATPSRVRGAILAALAYFVMPLDMIPDVLLGVGFTDDASVLMGVLALVRAHVRDEHLDAAREALTPKSRKRS